MGLFGVDVVLLAMVLLWGETVWAGRPIPFFDDYITCFGLTPSPSALWPDSRPWASYDNNDQLCSPAHGNPYTLGCVCPGPSQPPICSLANGADPVLFDAILEYDEATGYHQFFRNWCRNICACLPEEQVTALAALSAQRLEQLAEDASPLTVGAGAAAGTLAFGALGVNASGTSFTFPGNVGANLTDAGGLAGEVCGGGSCTAGRECGSEGKGDNCVCRVVGSTYIPRLGIEKYVAGCSVDLPFRRRDVDVGEESEIGKGIEGACACNASYVSSGCCGARDGWVWEDEAAKLGELVGLEDL